VPPVTASWQIIVGFALTIDGYKAIGQKECGQLANRVKSEFSKDAASVETLSLSVVPILRASQVQSLRPRTAECRQNLHKRPSVGNPEKDMKSRWLE
jgi:hypothetical protein